MAHDLAAHSGHASIAIRQHPARSGQDGDAQAVADLWDVVTADVNAPGRLAHALEAADDTVEVSVVLGEDLDAALVAGLDLDVPLDEPLAPSRFSRAGV